MVKREEEVNEKMLSKKFKITSLVMPIVLITTMVSAPSADAIVNGAIPVQNDALSSKIVTVYNDIPTPSNPNGTFCTGTLVSNPNMVNQGGQWVITAKHCLMRSGKRIATQYTNNYNSSAFYPAGAEIGNSGNVALYQTPDDYSDDSSSWGGENSPSSGIEHSPSSDWSWVLQGFHNKSTTTTPPKVPESGVRAFPEITDPNLYIDNSKVENFVTDDIVEKVEQEKQQISIEQFRLPPMPDLHTIGPIAAAVAALVAGVPLLIHFINKGKKENPNDSIPAGGSSGSSSGSSNNGGGGSNPPGYIPGENEEFQEPSTTSSTHVSSSTTTQRPTTRTTRTTRTTTTTRQTPTTTSRVTTTSVSDEPRVTRGDVRTVTSVTNVPYSTAIVPTVINGTSTSVTRRYMRPTTITSYIVPWITGTITNYETYTTPPPETRPTTSSSYPTTHVGDDSYEALNMPRAADKGTLRDIRAKDYKGRPLEVVDIAYPYNLSDIVLLQLKNPVTDIQPVTISDTDHSVGKRILQYGQGPDGITRMSYGTIRDKIRLHHEISSSEVRMDQKGYAAYLTQLDSSRRTIGGDSGGPVFDPDNNRIIAVHSYSNIGSTTIGKYTYPYISGSMPFTDDYISTWINNVMKIK